MAEKSPPGGPPLSFESALRELETIVQAMESADAPIDESLAAYERGMTLLRHCQETLSAAERRLSILEGGELRGFVPAGEDDR